MFFWLREIAGWALVAIALFLINIGLSYVTDMQEPRVVEAAVVMFVGTSVMRAGILLVRVSTAARACRLDRDA
ncbi:MAG: hypothetical protein KDA91_11580 [Planctomycetaceae bacterium]|nr:hypothetical protein [Planctomycetaceae bacterium]